MKLKRTALGQGRNVCKGAWSHVREHGPWREVQVWSVRRGGRKLAGPFPTQYVSWRPWKISEGLSRVIFILKRSLWFTGWRMVGRQVLQAGRTVGRILLQGHWDIKRSRLVRGSVDGEEEPGGERSCRQSAHHGYWTAGGGNMYEQDGGFWLGYCHSHRGCRRNNVTASF